MSIIATPEPWDTIDYRAAYEHYYRRYMIHQRLTKAFQEGNVSKYVELALGIDELGGNYSASEHGLGPRILQQSLPEKVFELAQELFICKVPANIPEVIYKANIPYLKISVGSEMATLACPPSYFPV